jgi:hypothetical protein
MVVTREVEGALRAFLDASRFADAGWVVTDLDGTAVHESESRIVVAETVAEGLAALKARGRPVVLNSLRFPLNVIRTFGRAWHAITDAPLPLVSLNGGLTGYLAAKEGDEVAFEEIDAFPLTEREVERALDEVEGLLADGLDDIVIFHYARRWRLGELVWTPHETRVEALAAKYASASRVVAGGLDTLRATLAGEECCMLAVLADAPQDRRMAFQHVARSSFVTRAGVDKLAGLRALAARLGLDLAHAIGAGDTPMDTFLAGVGLAVKVGAHDLAFSGAHGAIAVDDPAAFGRVLFRLAELLDERR